MARKIPGYVIALLLLVIVFLYSAGSTLAAWSVQGGTVNTMTVGSIKAELLVQFAKGQIVMPGSTVAKVVNVRNTGTIDALVRVRIDKAWGESRDAEGNLIVDPSLNTDTIHIDFNTTNWYYAQNDGYFYYIGVLKPGEVTLAPLMKEFTVDQNNGNEFSNVKADIIVHMECVQALGDGIKIWSQNPNVLGAYNPGPGKTAIAEVEFLNPTDGFRFNAADGDLFVNFKDLIPGESQSQVIRITNSYTQKTEIFMRADYIDQSSATPENRELTEKLLKQYATFTVSTDDGTILYRGPVWGSLDAASQGTDSLNNYISLGSYVKGASRNLTVNLSLNPAIDNKYQNLLGQIKWSFQAEGREADFTPVPRTGERNQLDISIAILFLSGSLILILTVHHRRTAHKSKTEQGQEHK